MTTIARWWVLPRFFILTVMSSPLAHEYPVPVATGIVSVSVHQMKWSFSYCARVIATVCEALWKTPSPVMSRCQNCEMPVTCCPSGHCLFPICTRPWVVSGFAARKVFASWTSAPRGPVERYKDIVQTTHRATDIDVERRCTGLQLETGHRQ